MKIRCGTDIIEVKRIEDAIENLGDKFIKKVFTNTEIEYCNSKNKMKYQHFAARFAAKEAIFKAISDNLKNKYELTWTDVEIINDENSRPKVNFLNYLGKQAIEDIDISLSHINDYAIANCVVVFKE